MKTNFHTNFRFERGVTKTRGRGRGQGRGRGRGLYIFLKNAVLGLGLGLGQVLGLVSTLTLKQHTLKKSWTPTLTAPFTHTLSKGFLVL